MGETADWENQNKSLRCYKVTCLLGADTWSSEMSASVFVYLGSELAEGSGKRALNRVEQKKERGAPAWKSVREHNWRKLFSSRATLG